MPTGGQRGRMLAAAGRPAPRGWWRALSARRRFLTGGGAAALVLLAAGLLLWPSSSGDTTSGAREYLASFTACLLTDSHGLAPTETALVWRGMENASLATQAKVEYMPVMSGSTAAAAAPYLASLLQRHCNVVVATGPAQVAAVRAQARRFPSVQFVVPGPVLAGSHVIGLRVPAAGLPASHNVRSGLPWCTVIRLRSVKFSTDQRPNRPQPLSLTPPMGRMGSAYMVGPSRAAAAAVVPRAGWPSRTGRQRRRTRRHAGHRRRCWRAPARRHCRRRG